MTKIIKKAKQEKSEITTNDNTEQLIDFVSERAFQNLKCDSITKKSIAGYIANELIDTYSENERDQVKFLQSIDIIKDIQPKDAVEAMLATQMFLIHDAITKNHKQARNSTYNKANNAAINNMTKLARTYTMQMEALNRYRGKGQQKITVEHLNVNDGGKAVIGSVGK